jgi:hypothetical protein
LFGPRWSIPKFFLDKPALALLSSSSFSLPHSLRCLSYLYPLILFDLGGHFNVLTKILSSSEKETQKLRREKLAFLREEVQKVSMTLLLPLILYYLHIYSQKVAEKGMGARSLLQVMNFYLSLTALQPLFADHQDSPLVTGKPRQNFDFHF